MVGQGRYQNAEYNRYRPLETGRENDREQLGLVADFSEGNDGSRCEQGFKAAVSGPGRYGSNDTSSLPGMAGCDVIGLARTVSPLLPHHGLSTKHVDTEARLSGGWLLPDDGGGVAQKILGRKSGA